VARNTSYKETKLPKRMDKALSNVDWAEPDVLVGALRNRYQLDVSLECGFYHMPATHIDPANVRYVAIYQSLTLFNRTAGIRWLGKVTSWEKVRRYEIDEIPKDSDEWYYRFEIGKWRRLSRPIPAGGVAFVHLLTNLFLLKNSHTVAELLVGGEHQFRWLWGLKKAMKQVKRFPRAGAGFRFDGVLTLVSREAILCVRNDAVIAQLLKADTEGYEAFYNLYAQAYPEYSGISGKIKYAE